MPRRPPQADEARPASAATRCRARLIGRSPGLPGRCRSSRGPPGRCACFTRADQVLGHLPCTSRRNRFASPVPSSRTRPTILTLMSSLTSVGGAEEHLIEPARHDVEGHAPELAGELVALVAGAELADRRGRLGDLVVERDEEVGHGVLRLHAAEARRRQPAHARVGIGQRRAQRLDGRGAARPGERLHGGAAEPTLRWCAYQPRASLPASLSVSPRVSIAGLRQRRREPLLEQLGDRGRGGRPALRRHAHVVEGALHLRGVAALEALDGVRWKRDDPRGLRGGTARPGLGLASAVAALPVQKSKAVGTATRRALAWDVRDAPDARVKRARIPRMLAPPWACCQSRPGRSRGHP